MESKPIRLYLGELKSPGGHQMSRVLVRKDLVAAMLLLNWQL